ncbi:MAG: hypothetical protein E6K80_00615 [Candidatus Eisenbacteria bacterium]|uniref:NolW-like domain-containing protein n=1 Tax=Eiseniibacteriota bacterium TaxID=2212470 RepID=A0A538UBG5_UNCEI|nr:MAG: hypothetical protein E6K80_00615 [Candidatus Eisenbacteria bacterium]
MKGSVRIALRNVGWQEALRTVLRSNGLDDVEEGGIIRVDQAEKLHQEGVERETARAKQLELVPLETRLIRLNYANAAEMAQALTSSLSRRGAIQVDKRTNSLIVTDLSSTLDAIEKMSVELDSTTPQIEITAKLVDVDAEALRGLGIQWNIGQDQPARRRGEHADPGSRGAGRVRHLQELGIDRGAADGARAEPQGQHHLQSARRDRRQPRGQDRGRSEDSSHRPGRGRKRGVAAPDDRHPAQVHAAPDRRQEDRPRSPSRSERSLDAEHGAGRRHHQHVGG